MDSMQVPTRRTPRTIQTNHAMQTPAVLPHGDKDDKDDVIAKLLATIKSQANMIEAQKCEIEALCDMLVETDIPVVPHDTITTPDPIPIPVVVHTPIAPIVPITPVPTKRCSTCRKTKPVDMFHWNGKEYKTCTDHRK